MSRAPGPPGRPAAAPASGTADDGAPASTPPASAAPSSAAVTEPGPVTARPELVGEPPERELASARRADVATPPELPPVVARLVVEIRSDGSRTIARGALEDATLGQKVAVRAEGTTPLALAGSLTRAILSAPFLGSLGHGPSIARTALRALLGPGGRRKPRR